MCPHQENNTRKVAVTTIIIITYIPSLVYTPISYSHLGEEYCNVLDSLVVERLFNIITPMVPAKVLSLLCRNDNLATDYTHILYQKSERKAVKIHGIEEKSFWMYGLRIKPYLKPRPYLFFSQIQGGSYGLDEISYFITVDFIKAVSEIITS